MDRPEYDKYLLSLEWQRRRKGAIERVGGRCQLCNSADKLQVHHRTYERLGAERDEDLTVLCESCHKLFHGSGIELRRPSKRKKKRPKRKDLKIRYVPPSPVTSYTFEEWAARRSVG